MLLFLVTPCLVVAVQTCRRESQFKKITKGIKGNAQFFITGVGNITKAAAFKFSSPKLLKQTITFFFVTVFFNISMNKQEPMIFWGYTII